MIAAFNNRTIGEADVIAWQSVLPDVELADAEEAVRRHYAEHTEYLMPAHIRRLVRDIHTEREALARDTGWAAGQAGVPRAEALPEIGAAQPPGWFADAIQKATTASVAEILADLRKNLPQGSREALMPRTVAWEKEHAAYERSRNAQPNPHYRPTAAATAATRVDVETDLCACRGGDVHPRYSFGCVSA
jgi:hypothetical protein